MDAVQKKRIEVTVAHPYLEGMDMLIKCGLYESQTELVKDALRRLLIHYEIQLANDLPLDT